jgi:hypothetical protein
MPFNIRERIKGCQPGIGACLAERTVGIAGSAPEQRSESGTVGAGAQRDTGFRTCSNRDNMRRKRYGWNCEVPAAGRTFLWRVRPADMLPRTALLSSCISD